MRAGFAARGGIGAREVTVKGPALGGPAGVAESFRHQAGDLSSGEKFPLYMMKNLGGARTFRGSAGNSPRQAGNLRPAKYRVSAVCTLTCPTGCAKS